MDLQQNFTQILRINQTEDIINSSINSEQMSTPSAIATFIPLSLLTGGIILGNLLVIVAVLTQRSLRTPQNIYLMSLAFIDMSVGIFILPLNMINMYDGKWRFSFALCKLWLTLDVALCTISIFHLIAIAVDRLRTITSGIEFTMRRSFSSVFITVCMSWVVALWISLPPVLGWKGKSEESKVEGKCILNDDPGYVLHSAFGSFIFPMFIMLGIYAKIYMAIKERLRERSRVTCVEVSTDNELSEQEGSHNPLKVNTLVMAKLNKKRPSSQIQEIVNQKLRFSLSRERRAARTLGMIIGGFAICWLPFCVIYVLSPFLPNGPNPIALDIFTWLGYTNSLINPIIYNGFSKDFRKAFKKILRIK